MPQNSRVRVRRARIGGDLEPDLATMLAIEGKQQARTTIIEADEE